MSAEKQPESRICAYLITSKQCSLDQLHTWLHWFQNHLVCHITAYGKPCLCPRPRANELCHHHTALLAYGDVKYMNRIKLGCDGLPRPQKRYFGDEFYLVDESALLSMFPDPPDSDGRCSKF